VGDVHPLRPPGGWEGKVIEEKVVDGQKVKVLPPGYAQGAYPQKGLDHGVGHFQPLSITLQRHL